MSGLAAEIDAIRNEIDEVLSILAEVRDEALADDGVIDEQEAAEIQDLEAQVDDLRRALQDMQAELAQQDEGGILSGIVDGVQDVLGGVADAVSDAVSEASDEIVGASEALAGGTAGNRQGGQSAISASVGAGGQNDPADVTVIQTLLNKAGAGLSVDGLSGPKTIGEITSFQDSNGCPTSGLIAPGDGSWSVLKAGGRASQMAQEAGSWIEDAAGAVADGLSDAASSVAGLVLGEDDVADEEEIQRIHDELIELERMAEVL